MVIVPAGKAGSSAETDDEAVRIPLGKISLLRRIKRSIFEIQ
jgi:hypothetical protein